MSIKGAVTGSVECVDRLLWHSHARPTPMLTPAVVLLPSMAFVAPPLRHEIRCKSEFPDQLGSETEIRDPVPPAGCSHVLFGPV